MFSVKGITIERQADQQIKQIIIDFKPANNLGDAGCDATPEEIKLVKNIIKQIKTNEKTKGFTWDYGN